MKKTYHLCLSSENEILFRSHEDFIRGINCLCLAAYKMGCPLLAYAFMSNHVHICVRTASPEKFIRTFWFAYTRYFNSKYSRRGHLGEPGFFKLEINGLYHLLLPNSNQFLCIMDLELLIFQVHLENNDFY